MIFLNPSGARRKREIGSKAKEEGGPRLDQREAPILRLQADLVPEGEGPRDGEGHVQLPRGLLGGKGQGFG